MPPPSPPPPSSSYTRRPARSPSVAGSSCSPSGYPRRSVSSSRTRSSSSRRYLLPHPQPHHGSSQQRKRYELSPPPPSSAPPDTSEKELPQRTKEGEPDEAGGALSRPSPRTDPPPRGRAHQLRAWLVDFLGDAASERRYVWIMARLSVGIKHFLGWRDDASVSTGGKAPGRGVAGRAWLGPRWERWVSPQLEGYILAVVASLLGICGLLLLFSKTNFLQEELMEGEEKVLIVGSLGAAVVLLYSLPLAPPSQPRAVVVGQLVSSLVGCTVCKLFLLSGSSHYRDSLYPVVPGGPTTATSPGSVIWVAGGLATALAVAGMKATGSVHPPGGATALLSCTLSGVARLGYLLVPMVVLSSVILVIIALVLTNLTRLRYPVFWWTLPPPNPAPLLPTSVSPERSSASSSPPLAAPKSKSGKPRRRPPQRSLSRPRQVPSDCEDDAGGDWMDDEIGERVDTALGELEIMDRIGEAEEDGAREERRGRTRTVAR